VGSNGRVEEGSEGKCRFGNNMSTREKVRGSKDDR